MTPHIQRSEGLRTTYPFSGNQYRIARLQYEAANPKKAKPKKPPEDKTWKQRYQVAHEKHYSAEFPQAYKDGYYTPPLYPDTRTANGLSNAITNYLLYNGGIGNRINVIGIRGRKSTTLKGTADLDCTMPNGKNAKIEIKVGTDRPRPEQLAMQARVRKTGGVYEFVRNMNEFYYIYDTINSPELFR